MIVRVAHLLTVEILYYLPDHKHILQSFIWQEYDIPPQYAKFHSFIEFWKKRIDGEIYSIRVWDSESSARISIADFFEDLS